jgi:Cu+-exporting ATPase
MKKHESHFEELTTLKVEGMTCSNCALGVSNTLKKEGLHHVNVNFITGDVQFKEIDEDKLKVIIKKIQSLGYKVIAAPSPDHHHAHDHSHANVETLFLFTLPFTIPLLLHMLLPFEFLHHPVFQLLLCIPVMIIGIMHFGKSAWLSLKSGIANMDVLIVLGSSAAFIYSLTGSVQHFGSHEAHRFLFYETSATIITLVLLGNVLEKRSVKQTTTALKELEEIQVKTATKITFKNEKEELQTVNISDLKKGDVLQVNSGDKIPLDGKIMSGNGEVDESMISGESLAVPKSANDYVIGGTILMHGNFRMWVEKIGEETVLSRIIKMVKEAQVDKPEIQKLGDKVSSIFVPLVIIISVFTFIGWYFIGNKGLQQSLMNAIAVLVISCPCAMGLATPTAVMVGIGRAARNGIIIKGASILEMFAKCKAIVFDKTGTLTTGKFKAPAIILPKDLTPTISSMQNQGKLHDPNIEEIKKIIYNLEKYSSHPIAISIVENIKGKTNEMLFTEVIEEKGLGLKAKDKEGNTYQLGSFKIASHLTNDNSHSVYLIKNEKLIAMLNFDDEVKASSTEVIEYFNQNGIETIMLSGDRKTKCEEIAKQTHIQKIFAEQLPQQKLEVITNLNSHKITAMVGDGINDAPALAKSSIGISLSNATQVAIQSSQIILLNKLDLLQLKDAHLISKHTLITIKQNFFWAFFYNAAAIPIAAMGLLNPMIGAFAMAFSDVIVIGNSIRLRSKALK